jgi:EAL domain-containing protein (putative c-di-GMP-specific phosphodiesterase class I)
MTVTKARSHDLLALHRCTTDGSLELLYQPEVDLQTGAIVAMEGLLRWHHGIHGPMSPPAFLDLAENSGEMTPIGAWVLEAGAAEAASWQRHSGRMQQLFLNVSASELTSPGFVDRVTDAIARHGLPRHCLGIEITEAAIGMLGSRALPLLVELHEAGVVLAVDDFGTWYSTLGALEELPVDAVKLDQRYVRGVGSDLDDDTIVGSVISLAHARGLYVVAEGVESWSESARLTELGCDRAHGYLYAAPQRAEKARWLLNQGAGWRSGVASDADPQPQVDPFPRKVL